MPDFSGGGAEKVFVRLANHLIEFENITFVTSTSLGPNYSDLDRRIKVINTNKNGLGSLIKVAKIINSLDGVKSVIGTLNMAYLVPLLRVFVNREIRLISRLGNTISQDLRNFGLRKRLLHYLYQHILYGADVVITQSKSMSEDAKATLLFGKEFFNDVTIYNPIKIVSQPERLLDIKEDFLMVGRLERQKDVATALHALRIVIDKGYNVRLNILGEGSLFQNLKDYASYLSVIDNVCFKGYVNNPLDYIYSSKCLINSSLYEGFSNVILESIALKTPVIATNSPGGNAEIIKHKKNGYLFEVGDFEALAFYMIDIIENRDLFSFDIESFEIDKIGTQYLEVLS